MTFLGSNEKVAAAMGRLKALIDTEEKLVIALAYSTAQRTDKTVERTDKTVGRTEKTVERSEKTLDVMAASMSGTAPTFFLVGSSGYYEANELPHWNRQ